MPGRKRNQVRETLERNRISVVNQVSDGVRKWPKQGFRSDVQRFSHNIRSSRYGSPITLHSASRIMVDRRSSVYAGQFGIPSQLGLPVRAKVAQALLMFRAARAFLSVAGSPGTWLNLNGISAACPEPE